MKIFKTIRVCTPWLAALGLALPASALGPALDKDDDKAADEEDAEEEEDHWFAAVGGDVYDGLGGVLRGATVLSKNGRIEEIGYDLLIPDEAEVLDVTGYHVRPGLVSIESSGLLGGASDLEDSVDPYSQSMILGLGSGITSTVQSNQAAKLKRGEIEGVVITPKVFESFSFKNSDPKGKRDLIGKFEAASRYLREYRQWQVDVKQDKELDEPSKKGVDGKVLAVLLGDAWAKFSSDERTDLLGIARLAQRFGFRPVIEGCGEGWTVADELGRAGAFAIVTPRYRSTKSERLARDGGSSIENAAILHRAGVQVAIVPRSKGISLGGIVGRDMMHLPVEAAFAIRGGLPEQAALEAITLVPARLMRAEHRIGTLEVGKDCDLIITDGDVLHYQTFVQWAVVDGKLVYDKEDELFFAHIRPRPEAAIAPETKVDPGESDAVETEDEEAAAEEATAEGDDEAEGEGEGEEDEE